MDAYITVVVDAPPSASQSDPNHIYDDNHNIDINMYNGNHDYPTSTDYDNVMEEVKEVNPF